MIIPTTSGSGMLWKLTCAYILVGCLLPVVGTHNINCKVTQHPNHTTTYDLPEILPLANCETQWLDENSTVLANDKEMDENRTLAQTSHSITILGCLDRLTYSVDCTQPVAPFWEVQCLTNCSNGPYKPATNLLSNDHVPINQDARNNTGTWVLMGVVITVILLAVLAAYVLKKRCFGKTWIKIPTQQCSSV
ncbi:unnamed protein product [Coregonus sp. 'balchen']|uniref:Uncharacterized protein n=1 Tax=Coregonus suidteri TaxID=861788 RepID=A0AAN8MBI4_9TELE|nr:unnamed protein product [Coregonus sp. 'balchen']